MQRKGSQDHLSIVYLNYCLLGDNDIEESVSLLVKVKNKNIPYSVFILSHLACVAVQVIFIFI